MRRTRYDIIFNILDVCTKNQKLTDILRKCALSWYQSIKYLYELNHNGLLKKNGEFYRTTEEGRIFLRKFEEVQAKLNSH